MGIYLYNRYFSNIQLDEKVSEDKEILSLDKNSFHTKIITCISILKDGRLASTSCDGKFNIYNKDLSKIDLTINHEYPIHSFIQLHDEKIIICSSSKIIIEIIKLINKQEYEIIQLIELKMGHLIDSKILLSSIKVIETKKDEFISIYYFFFHNKPQMTIWKLNQNNNKYEAITQIIGNSLYGILKLNKNEFVVLEYLEVGCNNYNEEKLVFRDLKKYKKIIEIEGISTSINNERRISLFYENMCLLSNDILCIVVRLSEILLIKISTHEKINYFYNNYYGKLYSICKFSNNNIIFFGAIELERQRRPGKNNDIVTYKECILMYKYNKKEFVEISRYDTNYYTPIGIKYKNNLIISNEDNKLVAIKLNINK